MSAGQRAFLAISLAAWGEAHHNLEPGRARELATKIVTDLPTTGDADVDAAFDRYDELAQAVDVEGTE